MFSRLPGKVSRGDVDFVKCKQNVFPLSGKVVFIWDENYLGHRDLACHQARSRLTGKLFVSYERKVTFHTIFVSQGEILLVNLSKCFLANRENFFPYDQALRHKQSRDNTKILKNVFFSLSKLILLQFYATSKLTQIK